MSNLADLLVGVGADLSGLRGDFSKAPTIAAGAVDDVASKFDDLKPKLAKAGKAAGVAAGAAVVAGAVIGFDRENLSDKLSASMNLDEADAKTAGTVAGAVFATGITDSMGDVNDAISSVVGSGLADLDDSAAVENLTAKAINLGRVFDMDVGQAASDAGLLVKTGLAGTADEAFDLIVASSQKVNPALLDELGEATTEYSKFFADLGFSGEEMFGLLAASDDKFALDKTGDAIKELSIRATDMSTTSVAAFDAMGLDAEKMSGMILAGGDTAKAGFDQIVSGLTEIKDPTEQANAAIALFGTPLEDLGVSQIPAFLGSLQSMGGGLGDVTGRADAMGATMDNSSQKIQGVQNWITTMLGKVVTAPGILGNAATAMAGLGSAIQPVAPMMTGVAVVFQDQLGAMASGAAKMAGGVGKSAATFVAHYAMMGAKSLLAAAKVALSWLIAMGPIALVIAAVVALVVVIVKNWDSIVDWTQKAWNAVVGWVKGAADSVVSWVTQMKDKVVGFVTGLWTSVTSKFSDLVTKVVGKASELWTGVTTWFGKIKDKVIEIVGTVVTWLIAHHPISILLNAAQEFLPGLLDFFSAIPDKLLAFFDGAKDWLIDAGKNIIQGLIDGISSMIGAVGDAISSVVSNVTDMMPWSPAKKGPLRRRPPELGGRNIGALMAQGIASQAGAVAQASGLLAGAAAGGLTTRLGTMTPSLAGNLGGRHQRIIVQLDGRVIADVVNEHQSRDVWIETGRRF